MFNIKEFIFIFFIRRETIILEFSLPSEGQGDVTLLAEITCKIINLIIVSKFKINIIIEIKIKK
jgi:hypothetical protein